ncbi:methyl-accepting chemotaxis protein [Desulfolutivibrio sulfoxidireducens]|uniref:methyl-accepting chemotaxis protein n=1 Tax=Desulfolutivibrio sulfoxidireducens TaxID=2773299 RepID=UPI00159EA916|nr:methyl-accepting chemotaxis protein [Desulfolutivibrio sulfoxidireducens]QLA17275.1 PAS domain-containing protein [Desulfolutivibrio sulfoxidireducens]QLA20842.1 PAS domain-containing protein [Desulfolutivibrio sulfoxidireducens]
MDIMARSIGVKVLILVSALTVAAFTGLFLANSYWQQNGTVDQIRSASERTSDLLRMAIEEPMALGKNKETEAQFAKVAKRYDDIRVLMTNYKGNITYATNPADLRKDLGQVITDAQFTAEVEKSLKTMTTAGAIMPVAGKDAFVEVTSIANAPACHHCHGASKPVLGSMVVIKDIGREMGRLTDTQIKSALISLAGLAGLLTCLLFFMRRSVINRIRTIAAASHEISQGALDVSFSVVGRDELSNLAGNLSEMVGKIKDQLEYNKSILSGIIIPLFVADKNENFEFVNTPLQNILGKHYKDLQGRPVSESLEGEHGGRVCGEVITSGTSKSGFTRFTRADGKVYPLHYEISPLQNASGETVGVIGVLIDLTQEERDKDRIRGQRENLLKVAQEVTDVAMRLSEASDELSQRMEELTRGVDTTAGETERVATAMEEMNATVLEVAKNAGQTAEASDVASQAARDGGREVQNTVRETRQVSERTESLAGSLNELSTRAENIGRVMGVIGDIADQTNLLALNAAIEAARAGEAGRGFAVVADEVRKLAEKTMLATTEVAEAIRDIQGSTRTVVSGMDETKAKVELTADMAEKSGSMLQRIVDQSDRIADMVRNIAAASEQQSSTSDEVNQSVSHINELSQDISRQIQEANQRIAGVRDLSQHLAALVARFREQ